MGNDDYCLRTVNTGTAEGHGYDTTQFSLWFGKNMRLFGSYACLMRAFNRMFKAAFDSREEYQHCKVYALLPTGNRNITIPSMPKSDLTGERFVRSCYQAMLADIRPGCVWIIRCIWQPGTYHSCFPLIQTKPKQKPHIKWLTDGQLDRMDLLMSPHSITLYPVIEDCDCC